MRSAKKLTVSATLVAAGVVFLTVGAYTQALDLTAAALSSLLMVFAYIELGPPYTFLVWIATAILSASFNFGSPVWVEYLLIFGIYPIIKGYVEKLRRHWWLPLKLIFLNLSSVALILILELVGIPFLDGELFGLEVWLIYLILAVLLNVAYILYDVFINVMIRFYMVRLRSRFSRYLK